MDAPLILASTSRSRSELLARLGLPFECVAPSFDERAEDHRFAELGPHAFALALARGKAGSVDRPDAWVLTADQLAVLDSPDGPTLLHKPGTEQRAVDQLMLLSGRTHRLVNGLVLVRGEIEHGEVDEQRLTMRAFARSEAQAYVARHRPLDSAGAYHIEDAGIRLFERIDGDHTGIMGLPLLAVCRLLRAAGLLVACLAVLVLGGCWNREAVWEATDAHRASVARPGESEAERLYRHGRDCMDTLERDDCAIDYFEQLIELNPRQRELVGDATFRLVELYRRHGKAEDAKLLLRKFWELGMTYRSAGLVPYGTRFAPEGISTLFMVDVARLERSGLHAALPQDAVDMMFTCDEARREQLEAEAEARREAKEQAKLAAMTEQERAEYEQRRKRFRLGRDDDDRRERERDASERSIFSAGGYCKLAAALGLADPRDFDKFVGAANHAKASESLAFVQIADLETKLAAAVEAGRIIPETTPMIDGRDLTFMQDKLRVWTLVDFEYRGEPVQLLSLDHNELTLAPKAMVSGLLHARADDQTRLHPKLLEQLGEVPSEVVFMTLITPEATQDFMSNLGAMSKLLPNPDGLLIAAVVYDYAGLFVRMPTQDSVKAWVVLALARRLLTSEADVRAGEEDFMGNLDISQARDGKALLMTNILSKNAVTQMFLGG